MAVKLMEQNGLVGWKFSFDRSQRRFGVCKRQSKIIGLSAPLTRLNDEGKVRDVVLH